MAEANNYGRVPDHTEDRMYSRAESFHQPQPERHPPSSYPSTDLGELDNHIEAYQQQASNGIPDPSNLLSHRPRPSEIALVDFEKYRRVDGFHDPKGAQTPFPAANYSSQTYQCHPPAGRDIRPVREDTPLSGSLARRTTYASTPGLDRASLYHSPSMETQYDTNLTPTTHQRGPQCSVSLSYPDRSSSTRSSVANFTPTLGRSSIASPMPRLTPDNLRQELEATKEYSERMLTKLMETEQLLEERCQMLAAALDDLAKAQYQTEQYAQECQRLRDCQNVPRQQPQPGPTPGHLEETRKMMDFYKKKVDQLSKENIDISRENRKFDRRFANSTEEASMIRRVPC